MGGRGSEGDLCAVQPFEWMVAPQYKPMEVSKSDWTAVRRGPPHAIDAWGLGENPEPQNPKPKTQNPKP